MQSLLKPIIILSAIFLILILVSKEIIPGSIFMLVITLAILLSSLAGLVLRLPNSRVDHSKSNKFNIRDVIVYLFALGIGLIMAFTWVKVFIKS